MTGSDVTDDTFLEAHYYDGGLRFRHYGGVADRPTWAPAPDRVGFRDELELTADGLVIEYARISVAADVVDWVGVYRRSIDTQLGDRQNHAGIGVWLRNKKIINPPLLIKGLRNLADPIALKGPSVVDDDVALFSSAKFLPKYLQGSEDFPGEFSGSKPSNGVMQTKVNAWGATFEKALPFIGCDILARTAGSARSHNESRVIFFCKERGSVEADANLPLGELYSSFSEVVKLVPEAFQSSAKRLAELQADVARGREDRLAFESRQAALGAELTEAREKVLNLEEEVAVRRQDDPITPIVSKHLRQFEGRIDSELSAFGRNLEAIENSVRHIARGSSPPIPTLKQQGEKRAVYITEENPWTVWVSSCVLLVEVLILVAIALRYA